MKYTEIKEELHNRYWTHIEYLIENGKNQNKINSNMDIASENLRELEALKTQVEGYIRDFKTVKKHILDKNLQKQELEK